MNDFYIIKSSGQAEQFDVEKLRNSLRRSGADETLVNQVLQELEGQWHEGISTKSIYKRAFKLLKRLHRPTAARYTLKQAMFDLGPTGFPFEDFFAEILKNRGYEVQTRVVLTGVCVRHEVDVMGEKDRALIWAECKYHPQPGSVSNVKIPLYFHSRFRDLQAQLEKNPDHAGWRSEGWLVTNTRFSDDAVQYGRCAGLHLIGWNYPSGGSLRELIDDAGLHPVTCLTTLTRREKSVLLEHGFVLSRTLSEPGNWSEVAHISGERQIGVMQEARMLCGR
jgi:ATP cone domain